MPAKRKYSDITGGTGDVNPQTLLLAVTQSAPDTVATFGLPLPIPRYPNQNGRSIVMELLSIEFNRVVLNAPAPGSINWYQNLTTNPAAPTGATFVATVGSQLNDPRVISDWNTQLDTGAALSSIVINNDYIQDLTDEAGHGILVATDNIYMNLITVATGVANSGYCRITYRFKEVSLQEYIGIVQSQQ